MGPTVKVLVTGGTGFIGKWVRKELRDCGHQPVILDHHIKGTDSDPKYFADIRDKTQVDEAVAHTDAVIHLAGVLGTAETIPNPTPAVLTNITGGLNVLEACTVYERPLVNIAVGNWWMNNPYSISKNTVERLAAMFAKERGTQVVTVRALNAYGPGQVPAQPFGPSNVRKITPAFVCRALTGMPIEVYGDGQQVMDMVWVGDVATALVDALDNIENLAGETYEAGSAYPSTVLEIAQQVIDSVGMGTTVKLPMRPGETTGATVLADPEKFVPGWAPTVNLADGIKATVDWYRENWLPTWE